MGILFRIQEALIEYSRDPDIRGIEVIDKDKYDRRPQKFPVESVSSWKTRNGRP